MRLRAPLRVGGLALSLAALTRPAMASPTFPDAIRGELSLGTSLACTICHNTPSGGFGTATTPFASYLRSRGLKAADVDSLRNALRAADAERHDSDGDGVSDIEQLKGGRDPNVGPSEAEPPPAFGCGAHIEPVQEPSGGVGALLSLACVWVVRRRRTPDRR